MTQISGDTHGLKHSQMQALERTLRRRVPPSQAITSELAQHLVSVADDIGRRVGVLVDRRGHVEQVVVGDAKRIYLPDLGRLRAGPGRFRGVRWIQTQRRDAELTKDDLADLTKLRLDYTITLWRQPSGAIKFRGAHLLPFKGPTEPMFDAVTTSRLEDLVPGDFFEFVSELEIQFASTAQTTRRRADAWKNRAVLVAAGNNKYVLEERVVEMRELCRTAGVQVIEESVQVRKSIDPNYVVGRGKIEDITLNALQQDCEMLVFDCELSPAQSRSIADATELKIVDRTQLILDIFAQHAKSEDGQLQVELAQLKYNLPRLSEMNTAMSRLTGGIGGRGPGETKMEINRRRARDRINMLEEKIDVLSEKRSLRRKKRRDSGVPVVAIVGYTNAGKSTLLNALTRSDVIVEDKLFATLDPASRKLFLRAGVEAVISDTVGFIRELPQDLVNAFRATLEELHDADLLLHVVDVSDPARADKVGSVESILAQMELGRKPRINVWNKADLAEPQSLTGLKRRGEVLVAAAKRQGLDELRQRIEAEIEASRAHANAPGTFPAD